MYNSRFAVTARIFNLIDSLSLEKQFILYKQLVKDNISIELFKLILDLSEDKKMQLLEHLGGTADDAEPLRTLNLDDDESFMRGNPRKICLIPVKCEIEGRSIKSYIIDISRVGVFIESNELFPVGQKIVMEFKLPIYHNAFQLSGRIARSDSRGIGVKFYNLLPDQEGVIRTFIESKK